MKTYLNALQHILDNGVEKTDRTGVGTLSTFAYQMRFDLKEGFPAVTTKKLAWKPIVSELLWFLEGSGDERRLAEILYGLPRESIHHKKTIWSANANADYWKPKSSFDGDLGRVYGMQWRDWTGYKETENGLEKVVVDQISNVIENIKQDPDSRRHIVTAWNPGELDMMALPPCHTMFHFYINDTGLSCHMYQRSADMFLGVPFNIASYALLTHMIAHVTNLDVSELVLTLGDAHIYNDHIEQVKTQLTREPYPLPRLWINKSISSIFDFTMDDIGLIDYQSHEPIKAKMAV